LYMGNGSRVFPYRSANARRHEGQSSMGARWMAVEMANATQSNLRRLIRVRYP
jgi:hypothetical protein